MDQKMKQRLTGAIVLVALAVIFVPIILEGPDDEWTPRSHSIPKQPQMDYRASMELAIPEKAAPSGAAPDGAITKAIGLPEQPIEQPAKVARTEAPPPVQDEPSASTAPVTTAPEKPAKKVAAQKKPEKPADKAIKGWFVQVGSFGQEMNASGLRDRLKAAGYEARLQKAPIGNGYAYRVLVGPSGSRTAAEKNATSLKAKQQLAGMVIEYP